MTDNKYEQILEQAGVRITAVRLVVLKTVMNDITGAFSLQDVIDILVDADNSSVFRTLSLFAEKKILHLIDDGSGMQKYCVCHCNDRHSHHGHVHLTCTVCHQTVCMEKVPIPAVPIPQGYEVTEAEYIIKGICPKCQHKQSLQRKK